MPTAGLATRTGDVKSNLEDVFMVITTAGLDVAQHAAHLVKSTSLK